MNVERGRDWRGVGLAAAMRATTVIGLSAATAAVLPQAAVAQAFQINDVRVVGNNRVDASTIMAYLQLPRGQVSAGELNAAYQRLQQSGVFESVDLTPQGGTLVVTVSEYPTVGQISIEGNARLNDEELGALIGTVPNRVYNPAQVEDDARAIAQAYQDQGRFAASVNPRIIRRQGDRVDVVFEVAEGDVVEVERLSFVGNRAFSDRRLRGVVASSEAGFLRQFIGSDTYSPERSQFDQQLLTDFYRSRGYVDFRIQSVTNEFSRERDAFFTQYNLQEGQRWTFGEVTASSAVPGLNAQEYLDLAGIRPGQVYTPAAVDSAIARMERLASQRGLAFVRANPQIERDSPNLQLDLNFALERGPRIFVERIDIEGNSTTLDRVIRRQFDTVEGDPFNPREIRAATERIRALGYFSDVQVEAREGTGEGQVIIDANVVEQPTGSITFGGSYSTDSGFGLNFGLSERNFLGRGQFLSLSVTTGTDADSAELIFGEPALFGRDLTGRIELFYDTTDFDEAAYNTRSFGFSPSVSFPISRNGRLQLRYLFSQDDIYDINDNSSPIVQRDEGEELTSALGYSYSYDTRDSGLDPTSGVLLRFSQDFAGVGGDVEFIETRVLARYEKAILGEEVNLSATLEGGAIAPLNDYTTRLTDRYFLSTRQLRGFEPLGVGPRDVEAPNEDALGGNYFAVARFEADFPLGIPEDYGIRGGVFLDAGTVWGLEDTEGFNGVQVDDGFNLRSSVGVSLFWTTPIGPLRFDLAEQIQLEDYDRPRNFNVTISTEF